MANFVVRWPCGPEKYGVTEQLVYGPYQSKEAAEQAIERLCERNDFYVYHDFKVERLSLLSDS